MAPLIDRRFISPQVTPPSLYGRKLGLYFKPYGLEIQTGNCAMALLIDPHFLSPQGCSPAAGGMFYRLPLKR